MMKCKVCGSSNPENAKYCRICGSKFNSHYYDNILVGVKEKLKIVKEIFTKKLVLQKASSEFTLDKFKSISLKPISILNIRFINIYWFIVGLLLSVFIVSFYSISDIQYFIRNMFGYNYNTFRDVLPLAFIPLGLIVCFFLISLYKKIRFRLNADYIENNFVADFSRIAKACKLGLFNNKNHRVLLSSRYDSIEKFDTDHLIIERYGKKGIFSIKRRKIIIPVSFDNISKFSNSVATATSGTKVVHYDIQGNKLK